MALAQTLECKKRDIKNKGYLKEMKRNGWVPGIIYGQDTQPRAVFMGIRQLNKVFNRYGIRGLFSLQIEGEGNSPVALIREVQKNPLSGLITHIDFLTINMNEKISSNIAVYLTGEEELMKTGGILQSGAKEIEVSCLPKDLPDHFSYDLSGLQIGDKVVIADLQVPEGVEILSDAETLLAAVLAPSKAAMEDEAGEETGDEAEPEEAQAGE
jgi:large subunit ribosomal protein L25